MTSLTTTTKLFSFLSSQVGMAEAAKVMAEKGFKYLPLPIGKLPSFEESLFYECGTQDTPSFEDQEYYGESCWGHTVSYETPIWRIFGGSGYLRKEIYTSSKGDESNSIEFYWSPRPSSRPKWGVPMAEVDTE